MLSLASPAASLLISLLISLASPAASRVKLIFDTDMGGGPCMDVDVNV